MAELSVEIRTPRVQCTFLINRCCEARLLLANLNVTEVDTVHANFLGSTKDAELTCAPYNELIHVCDRGGESTCCHMDQIVDLKLFESERSEKVVFDSLW